MTELFFGAYVHNSRPLWPGCNFQHFSYLIISDVDSQVKVNRVFIPNMTSFSLRLKLISIYIVFIYKYQV